MLQNVSRHVCSTFGENRMFWKTQEGNFFIRNIENGQNRSKMTFVRIFKNIFDADRDLLFFCQNVDRMQSSNENHMSKKFAKIF